MSDILNQHIVLVLNRNWQAINIRTPAEAFCQMATRVAAALDIELSAAGEAQVMRPVLWDEWIGLPVRRQDNAVRTPRGPVRVPVLAIALWSTSKGKTECAFVFDPSATVGRCCGSPGFRVASPAHDSTTLACPLAVGP